MIKTYIIEAISGQNLPNGRYSLILSDEQVLDLQEALQLHTVQQTNTPSIQRMREFFFEEEGYMANDLICKSYWWKHHE